MTNFLFSVDEGVLNLCSIKDNFPFFLVSVSVVDPEVPAATTSALEEMALYSNKRKLRQGRRSLEAPVPT